VYQTGSLARIELIYITLRLVTAVQSISTLEFKRDVSRNGSGHRLVAALVSRAMDLAGAIRDSEFLHQRSDCWLIDKVYGGLHIPPEGLVFVSDLTFC
jgi:hypothetical protein